MKLLYFDCFSGISGDMALGALLDAGLPLAELERALGSLALEDVHVHTARVLRAGVSATKFTVHEHAHAEPGHSHDGPGHSHADHHHHDAKKQERTDAPTHRSPEAPKHPSTAEAAKHPHDHAHGSHPHRSLPEIFGIIDRSALSSVGRDRAKTMFRRLAEAEAAIHQMPVEQVHLHEVGALDSIVDVVGIVFALEWIGADRIVCSPLNVGGGTLESAHGLFPVPAPATLSLLAGVPVYSGPVQKELVTPTGALIVTSYADGFGPIPPMAVDRIGYGAGDRDDLKHPNVLRVLIGEAADVRASQGRERVTVIECEIDDMNPQIFGVAMERLYAAGALEVFYVPVQMKKNRPGTLLTVIAPPDLRERMSEVIFRETTTIGVRHYEVERECLDREIVVVETAIGAVRFKIARHNGRIVNAVPEFDDCAKLATANNLPVKEVQALALQAYGERR